MAKGKTKEKKEEIVNEGTLPTTDPAWNDKETVKVPDPEPAKMEVDPEVHSDAPYKPKLNIIEKRPLGEPPIPKAVTGRIVHYYTCENGHSIIVPGAIFQTQGREFCTACIAEAFEALGVSTVTLQKEHR